MQDHLKKLEDEVSTWPNVSVHPHRFGGHEFLFDKAEVGHMHTGGIVDLLSHARLIRVRSFLKYSGECFCPHGQISSKQPANSSGVSASKPKLSPCQMMPK